MTPVLGNAGVVIGFVASIAGIGIMGQGLRRRDQALIRSGRNIAWLILAGALVACITMEIALLTHDFSLLYVAENGSTTTPNLFTFASLWAALEGSILLWVLVLAGYTVAVSIGFRKRASEPIVGWAMLTMFAVCAFFFLLLLVPAQPFQTWNPPAGFDGPGPNALLQNHVLMAFHPPMLYLGYVGMTVPFAFAVGALVTGRVGEGWLAATRRWTLFAWAFLTIGIVLGAWWSYEVFGWGGYWSWDPVENASFLPWLTATAFIHSVMVQERRGMLRVWNISLLAATFALTILGTMLTRSGVLESVHSFTESPIGPWLLAAFIAVVVVSIGLMAWRGDRLRAPGKMDSPVSREGAFLLNNVLFALFAAVVLIGTTWPLIVEAFSNERPAVGAPAFNKMTTPIALVLLFLMAVAPVLPWRKARTETLAKRLQWPAWFGVGCVVLAVAVGATGLAPLLAFGLAGFAAGASARQLFLAVRRQGWRGVVGRANGGMVVHIGVLVIAVAVAASSSYVRQAEFVLVPGDTATFAGHELTYVRSDLETDPQKTEFKALIDVDGEGTYAPSIAQFTNAGRVVPTPSVRSTAIDDVHISLLERPEPPTEEIRLRVTVQPLVVWLWIGGGIMVIGTALAAFPGRRRKPTEPVSLDLGADEPEITGDDSVEPQPAGVGSS